MERAQHTCKQDFPGGVDTEDHWDFLNELDEKYMKGGYIFSEYVTELVRTTELAFVGEAWLSVVITSMAGIESYLRSEYGIKKPTLSSLIDGAPFDQETKDELHALRRYRNSWVHVDEPWDDEKILDETKLQQELEGMARRSVVALIRVIYENPWV